MRRTIHLGRTRRERFYFECPTLPSPKTNRSPILRLFPGLRRLTACYNLRPTSYYGQVIQHPRASTPVPAEKAHKRLSWRAVMLTKCNGQMGQSRTGWAGPRGTDGNTSNSSIKFSCDSIGRELNMNQLLSPWRPPMSWDMTVWVYGHGSTLSWAGRTVYLGFR